MARNIAQADASLKYGKRLRNKYSGVSLVGKTVAVMGFGKVGSEVARRTKGFGTHVISHDPYAPADPARAIGVELVSFDEAIASADFISLHMPLTAATSKVLNEETFEKMKKGAIIVNVARGGVIDEEGLMRAIDAGFVAHTTTGPFEQTSIESIGQTATGPNRPTIPNGLNGIPSGPGGAPSHMIFPINHHDKPEKFNYLNFKR